MKWFFGFLISIFSVNSFADVNFDLIFEKCSKDSIIVKHKIINKSSNSLSIYDFAMPWSSGDFGVHYKIFHKKNGFFKKIKQDYFDQSSFDAIELKNEEIQKSIEISRFFGEIKDILGREELFVYWNYILINQDSSYKREFEGFFTIPKNCSKS